MMRGSRRGCVRLRVSGGFSVFNDLLCIIWPNAENCKETFEVWALFLTLQNTEIVKVFKEKKKPHNPKH